MKSKFLKLYNLIMEEISKNELEHIKLSTDNFINNLKENPEIEKSLKMSSDDGSVESNLSKTIEKQTRRAINLSFDGNLKNFLQSRNIDQSLFENNFLIKFNDDIEKFIEKISNDKFQMLSINECNGTDINSMISNYYKLSPEFVNSLMVFSYKDKGIGVGPGELGLSFFIKDAKLSDDKGDIIVGSDRCEVKYTQGRIPDVMPQAATCRNSALETIKKYIKKYQNILVNKELLEGFNSRKWLSLYNSKEYEKNTRVLLNKQFQITDEKNKIDKIKILKEILYSIFNIYGESASKIIEKMDNFVGDNFEIDNNEFKNITIESFVSYYQNKEGFDKIIFYQNKKHILYIVDPSDYESFRIMVSFPTYGDAESTIRNHTVLTAK